MYTKKNQYIYNTLKSIRIICFLRPNFTLCTMLNDKKGRAIRSVLSDIELN